MKKRKTITSFYKPVEGTLKSREGHSPSNIDIPEASDQQPKGFPKHDVGMNSKPHCVLPTQIQKHPIEKKDEGRHASEEEQDRNWLKISIGSVLFLCKQAIAFRPFDWFPVSSYGYMCLELVKLIGSLSTRIPEEVPPGCAKYTSADIRENILHLLANKARTEIRKEIGNAKFSILFEDFRYESDFIYDAYMFESNFKYASNERQMAIILRFVDSGGFARERFFDILNLNDFDAVTIKKEIIDVLGRHDLDIQNLRGQGYGISGACNSWSGLRALFLNDCSCAYYVHNFAYSLQLALLTASKKETLSYCLFKELTSLGNLVNDSPKWQAVLLSAHKDEIARQVASDALDSHGENSQFPEKTYWSCDLNSLCNIMDMYSAVLTTLEAMEDDVEGSNNSIRGQAYSCSGVMYSFDFIFALNLMQKIMGITDPLCQAFEEKSIDILNAADRVSPTRALLQTLKDEGFADLLENVKIFCTKHGINIPDMEKAFKSHSRHSSGQNDSITIEHHYRIDVFNAAIEFQLEELNSRFKDEIIELLKLTCALEPKENFKLFEADHIYLLAEKFYPLDFSPADLFHLRIQLENYEIDVVRNERFQDLSTVSELCHRLAETQKSGLYNLIDRLIHLVLTLPISTASTERAIHVNEHIKTALENEMEEDFLGESMILYIEREIAENIDIDEVVQEFYSQSV